MEPGRQLTDSELVAALVEHLKNNLAASKGLKHGLSEIEGSYLDGREAALEGVIEWIATHRQLGQR